MGQLLAQQPRRMYMVCSSRVSMQVFVTDWFGWFEVVPFACDSLEKVTEMSSATRKRVNAATFRVMCEDAFRRVSRAVTASHARVFMYHRFSGQPHPRRTSIRLFEAQVAYLARHYRPTSLSQLVSRLASSAVSLHRSVVITIDDGYRDFAEFAYPILEKYAVPATLYLTTDFVSSNSWLWFDAMHWIVHAAPPGKYALPIDGTTLDLDIGHASGRHVAWIKLTGLCLHWPPARKGELIRLMERCFRVDLPPTVTENYRALSWDDVRCFDPELVEIGAHTCTHPILSSCSRAEQVREIEGSKAVIEEQLNRPVESFCYPNGGPADFDATSVDVVRHAGFKSAVTTSPDLVGSSVDCYRIPRIGAEANIHDFRKRADGLTALRQRVMNRLSVKGITSK